MPVAAWKDFQYSRPHLRASPLQVCGMMNYLAFTGLCHLAVRNRGKNRWVIVSRARLAPLRNQQYPLTKKRNNQTHTIEIYTFFFIISLIYIPSSCSLLWLCCIAVLTLLLKVDYWLENIGKRYWKKQKERKGRQTPREEHLWSSGHLHLQNNTTQRAKLLSPEKAFQFALWIQFSISGFQF